MKKVTRIALMAAGFLTAAILSGCGSSASAPTSPSPTPAISISFAGGNSQTILQGQSVTLTVNVSNDSSGKGVTWSLSGQGTLSKQSGTSVQYDAPASVASTVSVMVTATSAADTTKFAVATVTINPAPPAISVSFNGGNSQTILQGQPIALTVTVSNDPSGKGVTWSLSGQGTLSKQSGTSVQYDAPASVASTISVMVTATSVADTTKSAMATITVNPPPPPIAVSFNGGNSQTILQGQSVTLTVTVSNDASGKGVTWSLSGLGGLSMQSGFSVQYDAPANLTSTISAMVTATSVADTTKSAMATITITPPPLAISTTSLPDGMVGTPYSKTIQATGGVAPFTWIVSAGTLPHNLNLDNSTTSTLTISGTPDRQEAVQFTIQVADSANQSATQSYTVNINSPPALTIATSSVPPGTINVAYPSFSFSAAGGTSPYTWSLPNGTLLPTGLTFASNGTLSGTPTVTGSFAIMVTVTDSGTGSAMQTSTKPFTIVVYASSTVLSGRYLFQFQGFNASGAFAAVGSFNADGFGKISDAVLDRNSVGGPLTSSLALTGTYSFDVNNLGTMTLSSPQGIASFRFTLSANAANGISAGGKIFEFDNIKSGTGFIATQDTTGFSMSTMTGDYVFNLAGSTMSLGRVAAVGRLHADGAGVFPNGVMDMNQAGIISANAMFTGTYNVPAAATNGRGTATLNTTLGGTAVTLNFTFYLQKIIQNEAVGVILSNDAVSGTQPLLSGSVEPQFLGAPTNNLLTGLLMMVTTGLTSTSLPDVTAGVVMIMSSGSSGNYTLTADENSGGTITSINNVAGTYILEPNGRVTLPSAGGNHPAVLYLTRPNTGYLVGTDGSVSSGSVFTWGAPFSLQGTLYVSTGTPVAANQENDYGKLTFLGTNVAQVTGSLNIGSSTAFQPSAPVIGTHTTPDSIGRGTLSFTSGPHAGTSVFYLSGRSQLVILDSISQGDMAPVVFSGGCIHFVSGSRGQVICQQ
jgi:hypothetical protein